MGPVITDDKFREQATRNGGYRFVPEDVYLTTEQARTYIGHIISDRPFAAITLAKWRENRLGPNWSKIRGRIMYLKSDIDFWLATEPVLPETRKRADR